MIQPAFDEFGNQNYLDEIISDLCAHSDYKMLSLSSVPQMSPQSIDFSSFQWPGLYKNARTQAMYPSGDSSAPQSSEIRNLGVSLIARGGPVGDRRASIREHHQLRDTYFESERFGTGAIRLWHSGRGFNRYEKSLSILANGQAPAFKVEQLVEKAWRMFDAKAYIHQYTRYGGFQEDDLLNALVFAQQLVKNYKKF